MTILGIILLVLGYALTVPILETIGGILVVIGAALLLAIGCAHGSGGETSAGTVTAADAKSQATACGTLYASPHSSSMIVIFLPLPVGQK